MEIILKRQIDKDKNYTIGKLYVDGAYFCDTLEDKVRDYKIKGQTAIPFGTYKVSMDIVSPKYSKVAKYTFCKGKLPRLLNVPNFEGILIHVGNFIEDTEGCILVGRDNGNGTIIKSTETFHLLYNLMLEGRGITITISQ